MRSGYEERFLFASDEAAEAARAKLATRWRSKKYKLGRVVEPIEDDRPEDTAFAREGAWVVVAFTAHDSLEYPESDDAPSLEKILDELGRNARELGALDPEVVKQEGWRRRLAEHAARGERAFILTGAGVWTAMLFEPPAGLALHGVFSVEGDERTFVGQASGDTLTLKSQPGGAPRWSEGTAVVLRAERRPGLLARLFGSSLDA